MIKQSITFTDWDGVEQTEEFYFHLSKLEIAELENSRDGGLSDHIQKAMASEDARLVFEELKEVVLKAYGERSADGKNFRKTDALREQFAATEACSELIFGFLTDPESFFTFVQGVLPKNLDRDLAAIQAKQAASSGSTPEPDSSAAEEVAPANGQGPRTLSPEQALLMDAHLLRAGIADGSIVITQ